MTTLTCSLAHFVVPVFAKFALFSPVAHLLTCSLARFGLGRRPWGVRIVVIIAPRDAVLTLPFQFHAASHALVARERNSQAGTGR